MTTACRMNNSSSHDLPLNNVQGDTAVMLESPSGDHTSLPSPSPDSKETEGGEGIQLATLDLLYGWRLWLNLAWYAVPYLRLTTCSPL